MSLVRKPNFQATEERRGVVLDLIAKGLSQRQVMEKTKFCPRFISDVCYSILEHPGELPKRPKKRLRVYAPRPHVEAAALYLEQNPISGSRTAQVVAAELRERFGVSEATSRQLVGPMRVVRARHPDLDACYEKHEKFLKWWARKISSSMWDRFPPQLFWSYLYERLNSALWNYNGEFEFTTYYSTHIMSSGLKFIKSDHEWTRSLALRRTQQDNKKSPKIPAPNIIYFNRYNTEDVLLRADRLRRPSPVAQNIKNAFGGVRGFWKAVEKNLPRQIWLIYQAYYRYHMGAHQIAAIVGVSHQAVCQRIKLHHKRLLKLFGDADSWLCDKM